MFPHLCGNIICNSEMWFHVASQDEMKISNKIVLSMQIYRVHWSNKIKCSYQYCMAFFMRWCVNETLNYVLHWTTALRTSLLSIFYNSSASVLRRRYLLSNVPNAWIKNAFLLQRTYSSYISPFFQNYRYAYYRIHYTYSWFYIHLVYFYVEQRL